MQVTEYDGSNLRLILIGMITDQKVCSRISSIMDKPKGPKFGQPWADLIAKWCREHLKRYNAPPNGNIQFIFNKWAQTGGADPNTVKLVATLLDYMSSEYTGAITNNSDFVLDAASSYFNKHRLQGVKDDLEDRIDSGKVEDAYRELASTSKIELGYSNVIKPFEDVDEWIQAFDEQRDRSLFDYPGELGRLTSGAFTKGKLFAFMGIDKVGKSFYLMDAAFRAIKNRRRVAYFEVGDLGKEETIQRLGQRILHDVLAEEEYVNWPIGWKPKSDTPVHETRWKGGVSIGDAIQKAQRYTRGNDIFRLSCHTNSSINVQSICGLLDEWAREDCWIPDAVFIDYADILAPPAGGLIDSKDQIDQTWKQLRRMSQHYNALVFTATQTGAQAYKKRSAVLNRGDFSGRKTKLAEANGILGINAAPGDSDNEVTKINWIVRRKGKARETVQVAVAGCLACAMPIVISKYATKIFTGDTDTDESSEDTVG